MKPPVNKYRQPVAYYVFWAVFIATCLGLAYCAYQNILPYQEVIKKLFRIPPTESGKIISILWFRIQLSFSWVTGAVFWAICQGAQIAYLLFVESEKALEFLIRKANSKSRYEEAEKDSASLTFAKRKYNELPLTVLTTLQMACLIAYVVEFFVNLNSFPLVDGGLMGAFIAFFTLQWDKFNLGNLAMILLTLFAVEGLVLFALLVYRIIEIFKQSGAYKPNSNRAS